MINHFTTNQEEQSNLPGIIFYDGTCGICNGFVQFVLQHERTERYQFSALQSSYAAAYLPPEFRENLKSIVLLQGDNIYTKSDAVLTILRELRKPWQYGYHLKLLPAILRDFVYDLIASMRHRISRNHRCNLTQRPDTNRFRNDW